MKTIKTTKSRSLLAILPRVSALGTLLVAASSAFANLIPINVVPTTGNGFGNVKTLVTFQNKDLEVGAVGLGTLGGTVIVRSGTTVAYGIGPGYPGSPTHEPIGTVQNNVYTTSELGITATGANTFSNLVLLFNGNEGGNTETQGITLTNLSLNLFSPSGSLLGSFSTVAPFTVNAFTGTGNAGFGFQLDAAQAAQANALFATTPVITIGVAARATGSNDGPETISIWSLPSAPIVPPGGGPGAGVPDSGTTVMMLGGALVGMTLLGRKIRNV